MNQLFRVARSMQNLGSMLPERWRLPVRYRVQQLVGGLEPEFSLLPQLVANGKSAIDVGANMGVYTYALSRLAVAVHAVEPQGACCRAIDAWGKKRGNVHVHNIGAGSKAGELILHIPEHDGKPIGTRASFIPVDGQHREIRVPVKPIDDLGIEHVGFIKIDAEGFERDVLEGASRLLSRDKPNLLVEIDAVRLSQDEFAATFGAIEAFGYAGFYLDHNQLVRCSADIQRLRPDKYNFIFKACTGAGAR